MLVDYVTSYSCNSHVGRLCYFFRLPLRLLLVTHMLVDYVTFFGCHSHVVTSHVGRLCYFFRLPLTCWSTHMLVDSITNFSRHSHICRLLLSVEPHMLVDYFFLSFSLLLFLIISCHFVDNSVS